MRGLLALAFGLILAQPLRAADWEAPPEEKARTSPVTIDSKALAKGRAIYQRRCGSCHGPGGKGDGPAAGFGADIPDDLTDPMRQDRLTDGEMFWKITVGRRDGAEIVMPGFSREIPSEEDRWRVVAFLRMLRRAETPGEPR